MHYANAWKYMDMSGKFPAVYVILELDYNKEDEDKTKQKRLRKWPVQLMVNKNS